MNHVALSCLAIDVGDFLHVRKHPYKSVFAFHITFRLIDVEQSAAAQPVDKGVVSRFVILRCVSFEVADVRGKQMEAKQPIQFAGNMQLRQPQLDAEIKGIGPDFGAINAFSPASLFRLDKGVAAFTVIPMEAVAGDPSLNPVLHEFEIEKGLNVLRVLKELP